MAFNPKLSDIVIDVGGDTALRYGTLTRRLAPPTRGGEALIETVTRASVGGSITPQGTFLPVQAGTPKVTSIKDANGLYQPRLLLEAAATNKLTAPEDLSNGAWTGVTGTTVPSINNPSPRNGDLTASFLREDVSNGVHRRYQPYTRGAAGNPQGLVLFLKAAGRTKASIQISDFVAFNYHADIDLTAGTITPNAAGAGSAVTFSTITPLANGWFKVEMYGTIGGAVTAIFWDLQLENGAGATSYVGDGASGMYVWGCVATDNQIAGMYWGTGASRVADSFSVPFSYKPQPMWVYAKFIESGAARAPGGGYPAILMISNAGGALPQMRILSEFTNGQATYGFTFWNTANAECNPITAVNQGDLVEVLGVINADGSTSERLSINGGADIVTSNATTQAFPSAWSAPTLWLGSPGGVAGHAAIARALVGLNTVPSSMADVRTVLAGLPAA